MISLFVLGKRAAHVDRPQFIAHWRDFHGPLLMGVTEFNRHLLAYRQYYVIGECEFDGVALLSFADFDALTVAFSEPLFHSVLEPDTANFLDLANSQQIVVAAEDVHGLAPNHGGVSLFEVCQPGTIGALDEWARGPGKLTSVATGHYISKSPGNPDALPVLITGCSFATGEQAEAAKVAIDGQAAPAEARKPLLFLADECVFI